MSVVDNIASSTMMTNNFRVATELFDKMAKTNMTWHTRKAEAELGATSSFSSTKEIRKIHK